MEKFRGDWTAWFSWICNRTISNATDYHDCIESTFYSQDELLDGANMFDYPTAMFINHTLDWTSHISFMFNGQCLTSSLPGLLESGQGLKVNLNTSIIPGYEIFLHDPNFFIRSFNPKSVPIIENSLKIHDYNIPSGNEVIDLSMSLFSFSKECFNNLFMWNNTLWSTESNHHVQNT